ncbi:MAG: XRE family transcriptional regulator [Defluviitaleaceae bacterium]|nr:XRE family transcriptional regulator [Defluviitaleaceae bacterium]MCL2273390.1 XRE family transcriptional regulator [Defluviitaleaceae bacterium]
MNKIKMLRNKLGLSQLNLAEKLNISNSTLSYWERGVHEPDQKSLRIMSNLFQVSVGQLLGIEDVEASSGCIRIPVLGHIPAGVPIEAVEEIIDYEEVPLEWGRGGREYFALQIKGNNMYPKYLEGDIVIFIKSEDCNSGDECAVIINGDDATFKKVNKNLNGIVLQPLNTELYEASFYTNEEIHELPVRVIGIAEEIRRKTKRV